MRTYWVDRIARLRSPSSSRCAEQGLFGLSCNAHAGLLAITGRFDILATRFRRGEVSWAYLHPRLAAAGPTASMSVPAAYQSLQEMVAFLQDCWYDEGLYG